ncbi:hypothetical protein CAL7102_05126 [Dulcicalothrix desertica PCC 7102]|nr:hypothetical protein CAL7102_05126 [Dulcicalothrix desertica PCC 7102]
MNTDVTDELYHVWLIAHNVETLHVTSGQGFYYGYATGHDIIYCKQRFFQ